MRNLMFFKNLLIVTLVLTISSCARLSNRLAEDTLTIDKLVYGWAPMITDIQSYSDNVQALQDKRYRLNIKLDGEWNLSIMPRNAFLIEKADANYFYATVINPYLLFENLGGLSKMTYVQAELSKAGGEQGAIDLRGETACLYEVSFYQKNGSLVNFEKLSAAYNFDFIINPPQELSISQMLPTSVVFKRSADSNEEAQVQIRLVSKNQNEVYLGQAVRIPSCHTSMAQSSRATLDATPGQCVRHYQTLGQSLENDTRRSHEMVEIFGNLCDKDIKCQMPARFGLVKDGKIVEAKDKLIDFSLKAKSHQKIDVSWTHKKEDFDSKIYLGSYFPKETLLPEVSPNQFKELKCEWSEEAP